MVDDKVIKPKFFQKILLVGDIKFEIIFEILFLKINNINMSFNENIFICKSYIINKALLITEQVQLINSQ